MSTVIVIILSLVVLGVGFFMINKLMCGAMDGVDSINTQMKSEILNLFGSDGGIVIKEMDNTVYLGNIYGVGFAVRDLGTYPDTIKYKVELSELGTCNFSKQEAENFIILGKEGDVIFDYGREYVSLIKFSFPKETSPCDLRYRIVLYDGTQTYDSKNFDIKLSKKKFVQNICAK